MSDSKSKHWKESIGVVPGATRRPPARPDSMTGPVTGPLTGPSTGAVSGPATGRVAGAVAEPPKTAAPPPRAPQRESVGAFPPRPQPGGRQAPSASGNGPDSIVQVLGQLPLGSTTFGEAVARLLWPSPAPNDLRAIALIAGERHRVADPAVKEACVCAVGLRQRMEGLSRGLGRPVLDATVLQARALEWGRLAAHAEKLQQQLRVPDNAPGTDVAAAALDLLPSPAELQAEAALASEVAAIMESALAGRARELVALASHVPDIETLVAGLCAKQLRTGDGLYIEALASGAMARRALLSADRDELKLSRRALGRLSDRFDYAVTAATNAHARDAEGKARLAAWLRYVRDVKQRVHEAITKPSMRDDEFITGPTETARQEDPDAAAVAALRDVRRAGTSGSAPENAVAALQALQASTSDAPPAPIAVGAAVKRWWTWLTGASAIVAVALLAAGHLLAPTPPTTPIAPPDGIAVDPPLMGVETFGGMLIATSDAEWLRLDPEDRRVAATRLVGAAERAGLRAGFVALPDGTPLVSWAPGRAPEIRVIVSPLTSSSSETNTPDARFDSSWRGLGRARPARTALRAAPARG